MAEPSTAGTIVVSFPETNGASPTSFPNSPSSSSTTSKRKRDVSDDGSQITGDAKHGKESVMERISGLESDKTLIRNYLTVLQRFDVDPPLLEQRLSKIASDKEPQSKRQRSEEIPEAGVSISDKVKRDDYDVLDSLLIDVDGAVKARLAELQAGETPANAYLTAANIASALKFAQKARELHRRETAYPSLGFEVSQSPQGHEPEDAASTSTPVLSAWGLGGMSSKSMPYFSSLPNAPISGATLKPETRALPIGVSVSRMVPAPSGAFEKAPMSRPSTLGEMFASPRTLPPLQPPKSAKAVTKSNVLMFYHPEPVEKSRYRGNSYSSQTLSTGIYIDYSNATPSSHGKARQRERAQSLAGHKPSNSELEMSELDALFRRVFSSYAPTKDDSAAVVPSGYIGQMWWQRAGRHNMHRMIETGILDDETDSGNATDAPRPTAEEEEDSIAQPDPIDFDEGNVDPTLDEIMGRQTSDSADEALDETLQTISDLVETLVSYQRIRNVTLPTKDRRSMDAASGDMLRTGSSASGISEDEKQAYETLKTQLASMIEALPPYAVARLDSDRLGALDVSTRIEVRMEEVKGATNEDEAARARSQNLVAQQAAVSSAPRHTHARAPSSSNVSYGNQYASSHYAPTAKAPNPNAHLFPQTPARASPQPIYQQRQPSAVPLPQLPAAVQRVPGPNQPLRQTNGYGSYAPQVAKVQTPFGHSSGTSLTPFSAPTNPSPVGPQQPGSYSGARTAYSPGYNLHHGLHQLVPGQVRPLWPNPFQPYPGGLPVASPQPFRPSASPTQAQQSGRSPFGPQQAANTTPVPAPRYQPAGAATGGGAAGSQSPPGHTVTYGAAREEGQDLRATEQARARAFAQESSQRFGDKISNSPVGGSMTGLAGVGQGGGNVDMAKLAAARANRTVAMSPGGANSHGGNNAYGLHDNANLGSPILTRSPVPPHQSAANGMLQTQMPPHGSGHFNSIMAGGVNPLPPLTTASPGGGGGGFQAPPRS